MVRLPGHVLSALKEARVIDSPPNPGNQAIALTLTLKRDHQKAFERYLHELYDSHSPKYRHFLTQREIAARFGPSQRSYIAVLSYLERHGFKLVQGSKNRMTVTVRGIRAEAEHAFDMKIRDYRLGERIFYANDRGPAVPKNLAPRIQAVVGLEESEPARGSGSLFPRLRSLTCGIYSGRTPRRPSGIHSQRRCRYRRRSSNDWRLRNRYRFYKF